MRKISQTIQSRNKKQVKEQLYSDELIEALKSENKSSEEVELIRSKTAGLSFFQSYYESKLQDLHEQACYKFKYEYMKKGTIVFRIFDQSDKFYILLNGVLEMHGIKPSDEDEVEQDLDVLQKNQGQNNQNNAANNNSEQKNEKKDTVLYLQKILKPGACFGEIGLICNKSRTGTITCSEDSHFAVMEKQDFVAILKPVEEKKLQKQTEFLGSLPCFNGWPFHFLRDVYLNINKRQLNRGDFIFKEGDKANFVAIVTKGKFYVYKEFLVQKPLVMEDISNNDLIIQNEKPSKKKNKEKVVKLPFNVNESSLKQKKEIKKVLELGDKDLVGEEDIIKNRKRQYSIKCESTEGGEIIVIMKQVFRERILARDIAQRTIISRIHLKEQIFQDHVNLIEYNLQNFKKLLRENRAELRYDKLKEQRLLQEQEEYYKKYYQNRRGSEQIQKNSSLEVISSNNKNVDQSQLFIKNLDILIDQSSGVGIQNSSVVMKRQNSNSPQKIQIQNEKGSQSPIKSPQLQSRNSPREKKQIEQSQTPNQFQEQLNYIPNLIEKANEIINKSNEKKRQNSLNQSGNFEEEAELMNKSSMIRYLQYNRKNLMMDEKGIGIPLINPLKNEEELDRQVRKHLQKQPKRKNYLGEWRNGIGQMDKIYGVLRNAGYFDYKLHELRENKAIRKDSPSCLNTPSSQMSSRNDCRRQLNHSLNLSSNKIQIDQNHKITIKEIQSIDEDSSHIQSINLNKPQQSIIENEQAELKNEINNVMDYYLNQSHLYSISKNEELSEQKGQQEVMGKKIFQTSINAVPTIPMVERKKIPQLKLNSGKYNFQNSPNKYSSNGGASSIKSGIGNSDDLSSINYPLQKNKFTNLSNIQNKQQYSTLSQFYNSQNICQHQVLTYRDSINAKRYNSNNQPLPGNQSARNYESRTTTSRGNRENSISPNSFTLNQNIQYSSRQQSRQKQRATSQIMQDLSRPITRNQILKSSTPVDYAEKNTSILLEGFKEFLPKPFREFNPTHKPLSLNQEKREENEILNSDLYFQKSTANKIQQLNRYQVKQTISQFMNRHTQKQKLVIADDQKNSEQNKQVIFDELIDQSKIYLNKIKKQGNKSRDLSFNNTHRSYF
ncbi:cyclic nucleotide-binding domain protein (macronuclear) [Tetrahymena thermophila SB210]|uniref:Cyclic nucleotide-binding domain protein n=1 Tax=Tetrahymena thermophila (strain SB210) TaxID=312017 RepID=W7WY18_TETTS|nr:cyclic nucleotide-binding domain protein [Tetrahymena thermophila SB210]EWS71760.1 cyclic nucleotide-binding domain protein [Tetrahymena thermophila SB210]|eukprot:XP_012655713.1 cyclic nucleotide-binding domain protein [Tetrahymena thermophila SB210]